MRELLQFRFYSPEFILFNIYISSHANEIRKKNETMRQIGRGQRKQT
jgi:hypothetical protein